MTSEPIEGTFADPPGAIVVTHDAPIMAPTFNREQLDVLKSTLAQDLTDTEFELFIHVARRTGLDPFARQVHAIKRAGRMSIQTSIDGFRLQAQRSGKLRGIRGPWWCGADGVWRDVWLENSEPQAAKVEVLHADYPDAVTGVARWGAFAQTNRDGGYTDMWRRMGDHMLAKCAEALALRRAFPAELSGLYTDDEMGQADNPPTHQGTTSSTQSNDPQGRGAPPTERTPEPPRARDASPPPARAPRPQPEGPNQAFARELKAALDARGVGLADVEGFIGAAPTVGNIREWIAGEEGRTVAMLAEDAASLARSLNAPEEIEGEIVDIDLSDDTPIE